MPNGWRTINSLAQTHIATKCWRTRINARFSKTFTSGVGYVLTRYTATENFGSRPTLASFGLLTCWAADYLPGDGY